MCQRVFSVEQNYHFKGEYMNYNKLFLARKACAVVAKRGSNTFQNYKYVSEADIVAYVNKACEDNGLIYTYSFSNFHASTLVSDKGKTQLRTDVQCDLVVIDSETGEALASVTAYGESLDTSDKSIYKSQTGAKKYALMSMFGIATFEDPERDSPLVEEEVYTYLIPNKVIVENGALEEYVMRLGDSVKWESNGDAKVSLGVEDKKLVKFLVKE